MDDNARKIHLPRKAALVVLFLILLISFRFRTVNLIHSPGWFIDEGTYLEISSRIGKAQLQFGSVNVTFVGPYMTHPPFYFALSNIFLKLGRTDMYRFRLFNALLGVLATLLVFFLGHEAGRRGTESDSSLLKAEILGLIASFFYAIHPDAVMYNRMGLPYNLYLVEVILVGWLVLRYLRTRQFSMCLGACLIAALSLLTVYYSMVFIPFIMLAILWKKKYKHLWALVCIPVPLLIFLGFMALGRTPAFWDDIRALRQNAGSGSLYVVLYHYHEFFQTGLTYFAGMAGLLFLRRKTAGGFLFFLFLLIIHIVLRRADTVIRFVHYPVIPLLPLVVLGCAAIALRAGEGLLDFTPIGLLIIPILLGAFLGVQQVRHGIAGRFPTPLEFGMTKHVSDTYDTAIYINKYTESDELVIATPTLWSLLDTRVADLTQSLAFEGIKAGFYQYDFPRERFLFSPALEQASFVVLDSFTDKWCQNVPHSLHKPLAKTIDGVKENWTLDFQKGEYRVYKSPRLVEEEDASKPEDKEPTP